MMINLYLRLKAYLCEAPRQDNYDTCRGISGLTMEELHLATSLV